MPTFDELPPFLVEAAVRAALAEDFGLAGDLTSQATLPADVGATGIIGTREAGVVAGLAVAAEVFRQVGREIVFRPAVADGATVEAGKQIAAVAGNARQVLGGERTALNFLSHLSGVATRTKAFVEAISGTGARICDTRKTTPGLRALEKYAVRCGGGWNHRYGLGDAILIKDNHIAIAGGVTEALAAARRHAGHLVAVEVEVSSLAELEEALAAGAGIVLLDNMDDGLLRQAVALNGGRARLEASGGVTLERVRAIAATGVDYISTSRITMGGPLDLGLDIEIG